MKIKHTLIAVSTAFLLASTNSDYAFAENDIVGHKFENEMRSLEALKIMNGDGTGHFFPEQKVTRAQFAAFLSRALQLPPAYTNSFTDTVSHPLSSEVNNVAAAGIINGMGDGTFYPNRLLTREEIAIIISRVLTARGLTAVPEEPQVFVDAAEIKYPDAIQSVLAYEIVAPYPDQTFRPKEEATRAETAAAIYKMYNALEKHEQELQKQEEERKRAEEQKREEERNDSKEFDPNHISGEQIVIATKLINVYEDGMKRVRTYVNVGTEMKFLELIGDRVAVEVAGAKGYVNIDDVDIIPEAMLEKRAYYKPVNGDLLHYVARNGNYESYIFGPVPPFLKNNKIDYSFDGKTFSEGTFYQYFNYLPLLSETNYSARELDDYVAAHKPDSPLIGLGEVFKEAEEETGVNALYLLAHAIHESAWGLSQIATEKYNLFGIRAVDVDAYNSASGFTSFEECILYAANYVKENYLTPGDGRFYSGSFLGHKGVGVNLFYASDPYWGQKIAGRMYSIDKFLGEDDWGHYELAISKVPSLNVRSGPNTKEDIQYEHRYDGISMIVLDEIKRSDGTWYKIKSDHPDYEEGYIYADGEKGNFAEIMN